MTMERTSQETSLNRHQYQTLKWFDEELLLPIDKKHTKTLSSVFFSSRQEYAWQLDNKIELSSIPCPCVVESKERLSRTQDSPSIDGSSGIAIDNKCVLKTVLKRVRWLPEDAVSQLHRIAQVIDNVQLQVWGAWKKEEKEIVSKEVPQPHEIRLAMRQSNLLTYYALHFDGDGNVYTCNFPSENSLFCSGCVGNDQKTSVEESDVNDTSVRMNTIHCSFNYGFYHPEHVWLMDPVDGSFQQLIKWTMVHLQYGLPFPLSWSIKNAMSDALLGLTILHERCNVVHNDISPSNILFFFDDNGTDDYGITESNDRAPTLPARTLHFLLGDLESVMERFENAKARDSLNVFRGTLFYAPLERISPDLEGIVYPSVETDMWSLGIVFLQAILLLHASLENNYFCSLPTKEEIIHYLTTANGNSTSSLEDSTKQYWEKLDFLFDIHPFYWKNGVAEEGYVDNGVVGLISILEDYKRDCNLLQQAYINSSPTTKLDPFYGTKEKLAQVLPVKNNTPSLYFIASYEEANKSNSSFINDDLLEALAKCLHPDPKLRGSARELRKFKWFSGME